MLWRKWLLMGAVPVAAVVVAIGVWTMLPARPVPQPVPPIVETPVAAAPQAEPKLPEKPVEPIRLDRRWLPDQTRMLLGLRLSRLQNSEGFGRAIDFADPAWRASVQRVLEAFGLKFHAVARMTWAATDLRKWADECVVVLELDAKQDAGVFRILGQPVDLKLHGVECRRLPAGVWPHPFAVIDQRTVVSGPEPLLRQLASRAEVKLENAAIARLLEAPVSDADAALLVDLVAARAAGWRLPDSALDVWASGRTAWRLIWEMPQAVGITCQTVDRNLLEIGLVCDGETFAQRVHAAVNELIPAAKSSLAAQNQSLDEKVRAGEVTANAAAVYGRLLKQAQTDLDAARWEIAGDTIWMRIESAPGLSDLVAAAWGSREAMRAGWLGAARAADEANHRRLLEGLESHRKSEGSFPPGVGGGTLLAPDTRLSWIASMLPYFGHRDWHQELEFGYNWNGVQNRPVASRPLNEVINPALGAATTDTGFPATHYVGVAGVGPDAAELGPRDRRAGVFGFGRKTRLQDIPDGASNTIATAGVSGQIGPWAAGGRPTVRAFTQQPYINGPDGFGSGQPDGMFVGMADGSVRFLPKETDPAVLEHLATAGGGEKVDWAAISPKPAGPAPPPAVADVQESKPEQPDMPAPPAVAEEPPAPSPPVAAQGPAVDVQARLADPVAQIEFPGTPLITAVDLLAQMSTIPVTYDLDALEMLNVGLFAPVKARAAGATMGDVFNAVLSSKGLVFVAEDGQLLVTCPAKMRIELRQVRYTVSDLIGPGDTAAALAELVRRMVVPESWRQLGGQGTVEATGDALTVTQTDLVHYQVLSFCERLRVARGLPLRSRLAPEKFSLITHTAMARGRLDRQVTAGFHEAVPLVRILTDLEGLTGTTIVVNWRALAEEGLSPQVESTLKVHQQPLAKSLTQLLQPLGLAYRAVDADTLEVTSRKAVSSRLELEFYPVRDLVGGGAQSNRLVERIKDEVGGGTWDDAGGPGVVHFDGPSSCLIVLQSQPVQVELETFLAGQRSGG